MSFGLLKWFIKTFVLKIVSYTKLVQDRFGALLATIKYMRQTNDLNEFH